MERELEQLHKENTQLELNITQTQQKLKATDKELHKERQKVWGTATVQHSQWSTVLDNEVCEGVTVQKH